VRLGRTGGCSFRHKPSHTLVPFKGFAPRVIYEQGGMAFCDIRTKEVEHFPQQVCLEDLLLGGEGSRERGRHFLRGDSGLYGTAAKLVPEVPCTVLCGDWNRWEM